MNTAVYISIMAVVTYLIRSVPFMLFKEKLKSHFFIIFFDYIPYAVLG
ncbi:MAG: AzlD domain-containing protein, partial [Clostridia bacterium]|nr:AzlD domain-containing protein [Clostridia bacterium]